MLATTLRVFRAPALRLRVAPAALACRQTRWISSTSPCFSALEAARQHVQLDGAEGASSHSSFSSKTHRTTRNEHDSATLSSSSPSSATSSSSSTAPAPSSAPFSQLKGIISDETLKAITVRPFKFTQMTPVQESVLSLLPEIALPLSYSGSLSNSTPRKKDRDLMVKAKTGTGKTLAFLVPAIEARARLLEEIGKRAQEAAGSAAADESVERRAKMKYAMENVGTLILSPTRELVAQIVMEAKALTTHHGYAIHTFTGGASKEMQLRNWAAQRKDIVVATTGRLNDLLFSEPSVANAFKKTQILILDEADRMLDMGFREDIERIVRLVPETPERQTFLFSATINKSIEQIARSTLARDHVYINAVSEDESPVHAHVPQYHTVVPTAADQIPHVLRLLAHDQLTHAGASKAIIFLPTTKLTVMFSDFLRELRVALPAGRATRIYEIHSKKSQEYRSKTSQFFRADKSGASILVTSDVSARGVDYPGVTRVVQVGLPSSTEQYIHRVGRTGRTGGTVSGRGDLVLLPWERQYADWQLRKLPLKPLTSGDMNTQLVEMCTRYDEDPKAFLPEGTEFPSIGGGRFGHRDRRRGASSAGENDKVIPRPPTLRKIESMQAEVDNLMSFIDADVVRETFCAQLGYYISLVDNNIMDRDVVLNGIRTWTVEALGQKEAPFVSESFLRQLGFRDSDENESGARRGRRDSRSQGRSSGFKGSRDGYVHKGDGYRDREGRTRRTEGTWLSEGGGPKTRGRDYQRGSKRMFDNRDEREGGSGRERERDRSRSRSRVFSRRDRVEEEVD